MLLGKSDGLLFTFITHKIHKKSQLPRRKACLHSMIPDILVYNKDSIAFIAWCPDETQHQDEECVMEKICSPGCHEAKERERESIAGRKCPNICFKGTPPMMWLCFIGLHLMKDIPLPSSTSGWQLSF